MTAQGGTAMIVMAYLLLAAAIAGLVALVFFALRASSRHRAARTAGAEKGAVLGLLGTIFVVTTAAVGAVLGWKISAPNDDC